MGQYEILKYLLEKNEWQTCREVSEGLGSPTNLIGKGLKKLSGFGLILRREGITTTNNVRVSEYKCRKDDGIPVR